MRYMRRSNPWSQIRGVVYAMSEIDLYNIVGAAPEHLLLPCRDVFAHSKCPIEVLGPIGALEVEARAVYENFWKPAHGDGNA